MKCYHHNCSAFLALGLILLLTGRSSAAAVGMIRIEPLGGEQDDWRPHPVYWLYFGPILHEFDPDEEQRQIEQFPAESDRPLVRDREAVLPNPATGRELVDRTLAEGMQGRPLDVQTAPAPNLQRVYQRQRLAAPGFVLPVPRGG